MENNPISLATLTNISHQLTKYIFFVAFTQQNLPILCSVAAECVSAFAVDKYLQDHLQQAGVLWHLLLYLFQYDFTLYESGVEASEGSNQQVGQQ